MSTVARPTRRGVLVGMVAALAAACTNPPPPLPPDPLADLAVRARADAAMARAVASASPALAERAGLVAQARTEHATVLQAELDRERPPLSTSASAPPTTTAAPVPPSGDEAALRALVDGLTGAQEQAAALVATLPRHRAGMVGSVAAGCASLQEVLS